MLDFVIEIDKNLFLYLNELGTPFWDSFWLYLSRTYSGVTLPLYLFLLISTYHIFGLKKAILVLGFAITLLLCTEYLSVFMKNGVGRLRPCYTHGIIEKMRLVKSYCGGKFGYFSAHSGNSFALATFFGLVLQNKAVLYFLLFWASLVSYSRIYIGVHIPLDVFTGIFVGLFFGWLFSTLFFRQVERRFNQN